MKFKSKNFLRLFLIIFRTCSVQFFKIKKIMSTTSKLANGLYRTLIPHEEAVKRVESLIMWQKTAYSAILLVIIELCFILIYFLPFNTIANAALVIGVVCVSNVVINSFPSILNIFLNFDLPEVPADAPNRIRSVAEISAFITTCLSFVIKIIELAFKSVIDKSLVYSGITVAIMTVLFTFVFILGDFWFVWLVFHAIFILPGIILQPKVQAWLFQSDEEQNEERQPVSIPPDGTTLNPDTEEGNDGDDSK